jgi:cardiolipin synthase A/B
MLVITLPFAGIIFYFSVGINYRKNKLYQKKLRIDKEAFPDLELNVRQFSKEIITSRASELKQFLPLAKTLSRKPTSMNNQVSLLTNGETKFPALLKSLDQAKHHIHIEYYIYEDDQIGDEVAEMLIKKAKQGVKVRFIYDDYGSRHIKKKLIEKMKQEGVEASPFYQISLLFFANRLNYRNHRKIVVVDGLTGYVGGINISDSYDNRNENKYFWRDTHIKIDGMAVLNLQNIFLADWNFCTKQSIHFSTQYFPIQKRDDFFGNQLVQVVDSGPDSEHPNIKYSFIQAIQLAQKEILMTTPYFIPDNSFLDALKIACLSGVKVALIVPDISDSNFVNIACRSYYEDLLKIGVEIYQYKKGFIHSKTMLCDEYLSIIGTANLDNRSFDLNFEVNALVYDKNLAMEMKRQLILDMEASEKIDFEKWKARPLTKRLVEKIVHLFSPLL